MEYNIQIERKAKGKRTLFFGTINGKRIGSTNWARKYDAEAQIRLVMSSPTKTKLNAYLAA